MQVPVRLWRNGTLNIADRNINGRKHWKTYPRTQQCYRQVNTGTDAGSLHPNPPMRVSRAASIHMSPRRKWVDRVGQPCKEDAQQQ